jgi:hypothetical protein
MKILNVFRQNTDSASGTHEGMKRCVKRFHDLEEAIGNLLKMCAIMYLPVGFMSKPIQAPLKPV